MKNKGPVDFFLGVFLEFGAAFCLLFFLPNVPFHLVSEEPPHITHKPRQIEQYSRHSQPEQLSTARPLGRRSSYSRIHSSDRLRLTQ